MHKPTIQSIHKEYYTFTNNEPVVLVIQYNKLIKEWKFIRYSCKFCTNNFKTLDGYHKHPKSCKVLNTSKKKKKDDEMPIQTVMIKGEKMYRWGDSGKLYKERSQAEKQAQAAYASGYKEPKKDMKGK